MENKFSEGEMVFSDFGNGEILTSNPLDGTSYTLVYFDDKVNFKYSFKELFGMNLVPLYSFAQKANDGSIFISVNEHLIQFRNGKIVNRAPRIGSLIIWMCIDDDNNLWASTFEGGVYLFHPC